MKRKLLVFCATVILCCSQKTIAQYANTTLSNLTPPTAINADLIPNADISYSLGSSTINWRKLYFRGFAYYGTQRIIQINRPNTFVGYGAGQDQFGVDVASEQASYNTGVGFMALGSGSSNSANTAVGANALSSASYQTNYNVGIGAWALQMNTGNSNSALGYFALQQNTSGLENTAVGAQTLQLNGQSSGNTALGFKALYYNNSGQYNTAVGHSALSNNYSGSNNVSIGRQSMLTNFSGQSNIGIGLMSLFNNYSGSNNIAIGSQSAYNNQSGSYNVGVGWAALFNNGNSYNVGVGLQAGYHLTTQGTFLGTYADAVDGSFNVTAIGYGAQATADNQVKIGNPAVTSIGGYANWTNFSDGRYKENIKENVPGLAFINQLKPVTYTLDIDGIENALTERSGAKNASLSKIQASGNSGTEVNNIPARNQSPQDIQAKQQKAKVVYTGFVAQDVEKAAKAVNYDFSGVDVPKNKNDFYGLRYADFVIPLVKAVQELSQKNDELTQKNDQLQQQNDQLEKRLTKLENLLNLSSVSNNVTLSSASISQNEPNPFNGSSVIHYVVPGRFSNARVDFIDNLGKVIKSVSIKSSTGNITIDASLLSSGTYQYILVVDDRVIDTKRMAVSK